MSACSDSAGAETDSRSACEEDGIAIVEIGEGAAVEGHGGYSGFDGVHWEERERVCVDLAEERGDSKDRTLALYSYGGHSVPDGDFSA